MSFAPHKVACGVPFQQLILTVLMTMTKYPLTVISPWPVWNGNMLPPHLLERKMTPCLLYRGTVSFLPCFSFPMEHGL